MLTKLISITPDTEKLIGYCARVSNPQNQDNPDVSKLLAYCIKHQHWSIFEMAHMCVEVNTTRAIAPQLLRLKSFSFQEFSQRYCDVDALSVPKLPHLRRQDSKNRQNSIDDLSDAIKDNLNEKIERLYEVSRSLYKQGLEAGVCKETMREILPLGTPSRLYMAGSIRSWLHYCDLRCGNGTQLEHRRIAESIKYILYREVPTIAEAMWGTE